MKFKALAFLTALCFFAAANAKTAIPDRPLGYVSDFAGLLQPQDVQSLDAYLSQYEKTTSNQIFVAIVPSLEGLPIEDYSIRLAEKWKAGQKGKDNGVILLIAPRERKMRIEVGYGLEGRLTDADSGEIIRNVMAPFFRQGRYAEGIFAGLQAVTQTLDGKPFRFQGSAASPPPQQGRVSAESVLLLLLAFGLIFGVLFRIFGAFSPLVLFSGLTGGFLGGLMGGGFGSGGFSGGGFSGGGGGSFGGGGASGGW